MTRPGALSANHPTGARQPRVPPSTNRRRAPGHLAYFGARASPAPRLLHLPARGLARGGAELGRARLRQELVEVAKRLLSSLLRPPKPPGALAAQLMRRLTPNRCVLAYWHHARYSSSNPGPSRELRHVPNPLQGVVPSRAVGPLAQLRALRRWMEGAGGGAAECASSWSALAAPSTPPCRGGAAAGPLRPQQGFRGAPAQAPPWSLPLPLRTRGRRDARPRRRRCHRRPSRKRRPRRP